ncbi:DNA adenine methylase [Spiroplasma culicicola]|uniref:site-specific DNA-methyltransferase (adenine-specific) n=1 Tax=Spiroplasma culicicola AES-1 TaxID=1276246 RepID=W6A716_9MOLU|nr:DNA adenine methylase [Spiroplasma culicicola]AHI52756.1 adenine specific DNA methyltransferase [Spiroplasma culicicola AES-1]
MFRKSLFTYPGNKFKVLEEIASYVDKEDIFLDLFCGSGVVGLNMPCNEVILNDINSNLIEILDFFHKNSKEKIIARIEEKLEYFNLSNSYRNGFKYYKEQVENKNNGLKEYNKQNYNIFKNHYNLSLNKDVLDLFILKTYGFNNEIRFNSVGEYNIPIGKTDFNQATVNRIGSFKELCSIKKIEFLNYDFDSKELKKYIDKATVIYIDPPYLLTLATYNSTWNVEEEQRLINFMQDLINKKKKIIISNILNRGEKCNQYLNSFIKKNKLNVKIVEINYASSSYNKINRGMKDLEVLIDNYESK